MELINKFKDLLKNPNLNGYEKLLLEAKTNSSLYLDILFSLINFLTEKKDYDLIITYLERAINDDFIQDRNQRLKLINKLVNILLKLEDYHKLKQALDHRYDLLSKESEFVMQKFYYAVCYEGLADYHDAIEVLDTIPDNISNQNLVNKYLKLSMLSLKIDNLEKAKIHFLRATKFDPKMTNPIFLLAECDLLFAKKNYLKALEKYQDYYIKTKNKYRYLDRYIDINIEINNLADAYSFYQKHFDIMEKVLSKQSRTLFFKAGLRLAKKLKNDKEVALLNQKLKILDESAFPVNNVFDYTVNFLEKSLDKVFLKKRDIIHNCFNELARTKLFSKMVYVSIVDESIKLLHYTKGLLLEKTLEEPYLENNVYSKIKKNDYKTVYIPEDIWNINNDLYLDDDTKYIFVEKVKELEFFVVYTNEENIFYNVKKIFDINALILKKQLNELTEQGFKYNTLRNIYQILDSFKYGLLLLKENTLHLLNSFAKELLETEDDYISFESFQANLLKTIYVDQLIINQELIIKYQTKRVKVLKFLIYKDDLDIYLLTSEETNKQEIKKIKDYSILENLVLEEESSLVMFSIRNYYEVIKGYNYHKYLDLIDKIYQIIRESARNHYDSLYQEGMDNLYLLIKTKDKRVIKRINDQIMNGLESEVDIRISSINVKTNIEDSDLANLKFLNALTTFELKYLEDNKNYRYNLEVSKTILKNVERILKENYIRLTYEPIVNWQTNIYRYIYVDVLEKKLLGSKESLKRVIKANNLEVAWDNLLINQLIKDTKSASFKGEFLLDISLKTFLDKTEMQKIIRKISSKNFSDCRIKFVIDYQEFKDCNVETKERNKDIVFYNVFSSFKYQDIDILNSINSVILNHNELDFKYSDYFLSALNDFSLEIIYNHEQHSLTKTFLGNKKIILVMGEAYGKYESLHEIKQLEE